MSARTVAPGTAETLEQRTASAAEVAARHADEVDAGARFPSEALAALAEARLLGASVPVELGGEGLALTALVAVAALLGAACSSTGMVFAMHHSQVLSLTRHLGGSPALAALARRHRARPAAARLGDDRDRHRRRRAIEHLLRRAERRPRGCTSSRTRRSSPTASRPTWCSSPRAATPTARRATRCSSPATAPTSSSSAPAPGTPSASAARAASATG